MRAPYEAYCSNRYICGELISLGVIAKLPIYLFNDTRNGDDINRFSEHFIWKIGRAFDTIQTPYTLSLLLDNELRFIRGLKSIKMNESAAKWETEKEICHDKNYDL